MKRFGIFMLLFSVIFFAGVVINPLFTSTAVAQQEQVNNGPSDDAVNDDDDADDDDADDGDTDDGDAEADDDDADDGDADDDDGEDAEEDDDSADDGEADDDDAEADDDDADTDDGDAEADDDDAEADDEEDAEEDEYDYDLDDDAPELKVYPKKVEVAIGETIKFEVEIRGVDDEEGDDDEGDEQADNGPAEKIADDITITWEVSDPEIGSIDDEGLFTALAEGKVIVTATSGDLSGSARVIITAEGPALDPDTNKLSLLRKLPDGNINRFGAPTIENDRITLGGLPYPLNIFNGSKLYIPEGALSEDISITIEIPKFAEVDSENEDVVFEGEIITGVNFVVSVDGVEVEGDYYFDEPLVITIPFKRGLLDHLGIAPEDLGMYFANDTGEIEDNGITDIVVDPDKNTITGKVPHFSTVVVAPKTAAPALVDEEEGLLPEGITLSQNVPNPFNPTTTISFSIPEVGNVTLDVFNVAGQKVDTLVSDFLNAGSHSITWNASEFSAGVYFYTVKSGEFSRTMKMTLLK